ncbi:MAG: DUF1574 domain-containing protein [Gemmataceae bacterium]|nr:DUF1574 domain-containing protein [Gemmataceae bacterium]
MLVVLAQIGLGVSLETARPGWRDPEYGHRLHQLRRLRAAYPGRPLVVAVGSSRTQMGLSPADMGFPDGPGSPLVYNFGQAGAGPLRMHLTLLRLLDAGVKPDYLLVEFFPAALAADGPAEAQLADHLPRLGYADLGRLAPYAADPAALRRAWAANRVAPWLTYRRSLLSHWRPRWLSPGQQLDYQWTMLDPFGYTAYPLETVSDVYRDFVGLRAARWQYGSTLQDYHVGAMSDRLVRDLVARCRAEGIPVAFYPMPESPEFQSWYSPDARSAVAEYVPTLGGPVFDAADGFAEEDFADGHHLLRAGAARFSRRLADAHLRAWLAGR